MRSGQMHAKGFKARERSAALAASDRMPAKDATNSGLRKADRSCDLSEECSAFPKRDDLRFLLQREPSLPAFRVVNALVLARLEQDQIFETVVVFSFVDVVDQFVRTQEPAQG